MFSSKQDRISGAILGLLHSAPLEEIGLAGSDKVFLGEEIVPILCDLLGNKTVRVIDIRRNKLNDVAVFTLANLMLANRVIQTVYVDDLELTSPGPLIAFLNACSQSEALISLPFPLADVNELRIKDPRLGEDFSNLRFRIAKRLYTNRVLRGIKSPLLLLRGDPVLASIIERSTAEIASNYHTIDRALSSSYGARVGVPALSDLLGDALAKSPARVTNPSRPIRNMSEGSDAFNEKSDTDGQSQFSEGPSFPEEVTSPARRVSSGPAHPTPSPPRECVLGRGSMPAHPAETKFVAPPLGIVNLGRFPEDPPELDWSFASIWPHSGDGDYSDGELVRLPPSRMPTTIPDDPWE
jgi:hypothetical protein